MSVLILGKNGQLATHLLQVFCKTPHACLSHNELNFENEASFFRSLDLLSNKVQIKTIINCLAYTNVEKAEQENELCYLINSTIPLWLANYCNQNQIRLIHISTDYVFDGTKKSPYLENDTPNPLNTYGRSKLDGEKKIFERLPDSLIVRTSSLFSLTGNNFLKAIIGKMDNSNSIDVVNNLISSPTSAIDLSLFLYFLSKTDTQETGIIHFANSGHCSRYEWALKIREYTGKTTSIFPTSLIQENTIFHRPLYSVLDNSKASLLLKKEITNWNDSLKELLKNV